MVLGSISALGRRDEFGLDAGPAEDELLGVLEVAAGDDELDRGAGLGPGGGELVEPGAGEAGRLAVLRRRRIRAAQASAERVRMDTRNRGRRWIVIGRGTPEAMRPKLGEGGWGRNVRWEPTRESATFLILPMLAGERE